MTFACWSSASVSRGGALRASAPTAAQVVTQIVRDGSVGPDASFQPSDLSGVYEIGEEFGPWLNKLQYRGEAYNEGKVFSIYGIVYVPDPYTAR